MCLILKVYSVQNQKFGYKINFSRQKHSFLEIKKARKGEAMKNVRSKSVQSRYFILSVVLILCMLIGMINGVPFLSQASGHEEQLASKNVMAKITLDGKNPPAGKFQFELVDSNGSVVDRTTNDAGGNIIFKGHELEVKEAKYTIRLVDGDKNINYGETTKNVNVYLKDGEEVVDKYEGITNITSTDLGAGNIVVNYYLNGKRGTANAFCINTDVALNGNISLTPIKDPDDATLSKYIVQRFFDWKAEYQKANAKGDSTVVSYARRDKISRGWTFERYEYMPKTNSVVDEIKLEYNTDSISQLLRKALYYAQNNFSTEGVKVDRFRNGTTPVGVKIRSAAERYLKERINDDWVKQNMIWSVVGGNWGTRRVYYAYHAGKYPIMQLQEESDMLFPANFKTHMRKVTQNTVVPDNYHVMIFASNGNLSQPLAFGYFDDGKTKRRVRKSCQYII